MADGHLKIDLPVGVVGGDARLTLRFSDNAGGCVLIGILPTGAEPVVTLELDRHEWRRLVAAGDLLLDVGPGQEPHPHG